MLAYLISFSNDTSMVIVAGVFLVIAFFLFAVWVVMLIDAIKRSKDEGGSVRLLLLLLFGGIYGIIYYFTVYRKRKESDTSNDYTYPNM